MTIRGRAINTTRIILAVVGLLAVLIGAVSSLRAAAGWSFQYLDPAFKQNLYGVTQLPDDGTGLATVLGGVAFAPDGDPWVADCVFYGTRLHRFDAQTTSAASHGTVTLHPETAVDTQGGCGLTNHPDGFIYSNSMDGVVRLDASTGLPAAWPDGGASPRGLPGNALGITADPKTGHVIYAGAGCHPSLAPDATTCSIEDLNPADGTVTSFADLDRATVPFVDGIYFDPTGTYLFLANRGGSEGSNFLTVLRRPEDSIPNTGAPQIAQQVPTGSEPDGVAFHASSPKFVITNDEDLGTMTKFTFTGDDYTAAPLVTTFASGGFRGDLLQVGIDGCIYATQGRNAVVTDHGTRYDDGTETTEDSLVRICDSTGGTAFAPGVGVKETVVQVTLCTSHIGDFVWLDLNHDGVQGANEPGIANAHVTLKRADGSIVATTMTAANGQYGFDVDCSQTYVVEVVPPAGYAPTIAGVGGATVDSNGSPAVVTIPSTSTTDNSIDFGFVLGSIAGTVYFDANGNGIRDAGEAGLSGVAVTLSGGASGVATSAADGSYKFSPLPGAGYNVAVPAVASGYALSSASPLSVSLGAGQDRTGVDFGYAPGRISGFAYADANKDGVRQTGEPGLAGVTVTLSGPSSGTTTTAADGSYGFMNLKAGTFSVSAPAAASGLTRSTASPLPASVAAGQAVPNVNFGYTETVAPTCVEQAYNGPPFWGTMTFQDTGSGIVSLTIVNNFNFAVVMPTFTGPSKAPLTVKATRIDATKSATLTVKAVDLFGNALSCDPIVTTITKLKHEKGTQTFTDLPFAEHIVTIVNDDPGLRAMDVEVNGTVFEVRKLQDNETRVVDVSSAMRRGNHNTIALVPRGKKGESATVTIGDH